MMRNARTLSLCVALAACSGLAACGGGDGPAGTGGIPAEMVVATGDAEQAAIATPVQTSVIVRDEDGAPVPGVEVRFTVVSGDGLVFPDHQETDAQGRAGTNWYMGPQQGAARMRATGAGLAAEFTATATPLVAGQTYYGSEQYIEFIPGDLPIVLTAPHGGSLRPVNMPNRSGPGATTARDTNTEELAHEIRDRFQARLGAAPSIIITRLHRTKIDNNREIVEATELHPIAQRAWYEWHAFIDAARARVVAAHGRGFYIDLHGHGHPIARLELGYMLTASQLAQTDIGLNGLVASSSIRNLATTGPRTHAELLRGPTSMGTLFEAAGIPAVPSSAQPNPGSDPYFNGGYNTGRYGSRSGGTIDGVQIETHFPGVRETPSDRTAFANALVDVMVAYFRDNYGMTLGVAPAVGSSMTAAPAASLFELAGSLP